MNDDPRETLARIRAKSSGKMYVPPEPIVAVTDTPKHAAVGADELSEPAAILMRMFDEQRREIKALQSQIVELQTRQQLTYAATAKLEHNAGRMQALEEDNEEFRRKLGYYAVTEYGQMPLLSDLTYIRSQIWYSPNLSAQDRRTKSVWSLRLSVDVVHHRLLEEINVRLFPLKEFRARYRKQKNATPEVLAECDRLTDKGVGDDTWAGCIQTFSRGGGRPYHPGQAAFLIGHKRNTSPDSKQAHLHFLLDGERIDFSEPRSANGDAGSALWFVEWRPVKSA